MASFLERLGLIQDSVRWDIPIPLEDEEFADRQSSRATHLADQPDPATACELPAERYRRRDTP